MPLLDYQIPKANEVEAALRDRRFCLAACATGSGKTYIALEAGPLRIGGKWLVIAPKATRTQWFRAAGAMGASGGLLDVINPERISRGCKWYDGAGWLLPAGTSGVIADEIHKGTTGSDSLFTKAIARLKAYPVRLLAMSATPGSSPLQMRATSYWGGLNGFSKPEFYAWCEAHGCRNVGHTPRMRLSGKEYTLPAASRMVCAVQMRENGAWVPAMPDGWKDLFSERHRTIRVMRSVDGDWEYATAYPLKQSFKFAAKLDEAKSIMADIRRDFGTAFVTLRHGEIPGFPEETVDTLYIDLSAREREEIEEAYREMSERLKSSGRSDLAENMRARERVEFLLAEPLAELVADTVDAGYSAAVFLNYTEPRERLQAKLAERGIAYGSIHGGQTGAKGERERQEAVDAFTEDRIHAIVANSAAGGAGISLHATPGKRFRESFVIPDYDPNNIVQPFGRIRRAGGTKAAQNLVVAAGTTMENVARTARRKLECQEALLLGDLLETRNI